MVRKITKTAVVEQYLNSYDKRYYLGELAFLIKKPHQSIKPYVQELASEGVFVKNKRKRITEYCLNFKDKRIYDYLVLAEKEKLMERIKRDSYLRVLFEKLSTFFERNTFILFGSSVDKVQKGSDIDLLVVGKQNVTNVVKDFENVYNRKVHTIQIKSMDELTLALVKEVYKKHLILNNTEWIVRFLGGLHEKNKLV